MGLANGKKKEPNDPQSQIIERYRFHLIVCVPEQFTEVTGHGKGYICPLAGNTKKVGPVNYDTGAPLYGKCIC